MQAVSDEIFTLGLACVALNLLAGPLLLRTGLACAGELPRDEEAAPVGHGHFSDRLAPQHRRDGPVHHAPECLSLLWRS
jgi:hypothetical protein